MKKNLQITLILIIGIINIYSFVGNCEENDYNILYIGGSGDGNYSSIQNAIDNAFDNDTIFVYIGYYTENLTINKSITLTGEDMNTTIINGNITILSKWVKINGFTINNPIDKELQMKKGIEIKNNSSIIYNNIISNFSFGIYIGNYTNNSFYHNNFINNNQNTYDVGNNTWFNNNLNQGNYWDDYEGLDKNNDGIGDKPYEIPGGNNKDNFPLMMPYDGTIRIKEFYVDEGILYTMLIIGLVVAILFCLPIGYVWYRKYYKIK